MEKFLGRSLQILTIATFATAGVVLPGEIERERLLHELNAKGISVIDAKAGSSSQMTASEKTTSTLKSFKNFIDEYGKDLNGSITFDLNTGESESVNIKDPFIQLKIDDYINEFKKRGENVYGEIIVNYDYVANTSTGKHSCSVIFDYIIDPNNTSYPNDLLEVGMKVDGDYKFVFLPEDAGHRDISPSLLALYGGLIPTNRDLGLLDEAFLKKGRLPDDISMEIIDTIARDHVFGWEE